MLKMDNPKLTLFLFVCFQAETMASPPALTFCMDNWVAFKGSCYYFHHSAQSFTEAQHACLQMNSNLVQIDSEAEDKFIKDFLSYQTPNFWWVGLSDDDIEGIWSWVGSKDTPTFTEVNPVHQKSLDRRNDTDAEMK
ncbi:asialoglycoprotein receptor 2-like isoform X2 [Dreissena polymorpha]|uniref:asialoglycoprotein receptor 2-like isoform X2 n=1 Tax=Dreissena polymorpha TaxID=45954 RepID=UPI00226461A9|nr:asialoglycoprotein receptor 2-like isoform X2 [Dreissena polymorpha]